MKRIACVATVLLAFAAGAAEKVWKGGVIDWPSDGWTNGDYWDGGLPGADDTAMFSCAVTACVTKADCTDVNKIKQISAKWTYDFRLALDSSGGDARSALPRRTRVPDFRLRVGVARAFLADCTVSGLIFHPTFVADLDLPSVKLAKAWINQYGEDRVGGVEGKRVGSLSRFA